MRRARLYLLSSMSVSIFTLSVATAGATPIDFWSKSTATAKSATNSGTQLVTDDTGVLNLQDSASASAMSQTTTTFYGTATANGDASVVDGILHASASAQTTAGGGLAGATATGVAEYFDTFTPTSTTLAVGTHVQFAATMALTYTLSGGCLALQAKGDISVDLNFGTLGGLTYNDGTCGAGTQQTTGVFLAIIGTPFTLLAELQASANGGTALGAADASHTLQFFLNPMGDFTLRSASGNDFSTPTTPVPEPASMFLVATGLWASVMGRRSRKQNA